MSQTVANVSAAKPKVGGAIYKAPIGTTLPTNATAELDPAFVSLGYMSDAGLKRAINLSTNPIKSWGGDTIANPQTDKSEQFTFEAAEVLNPEVQKLVNGDSNVSGTVAEGMTVKINTKELEEHAFVIEEILRGGVLKRTVIARASITSIAEVSDTDNDIIKYGITIRAMADEALNGDTAREYYVSGSATPGDPEVVLPHSNLTLTAGKRYTMPVSVTPESARTSLTASIPYSGSTPPAGATVSLDYSSVVIDALEAGEGTLEVKITVDGVDYTDTCKVTVVDPEE